MKAAGRAAEESNCRLTSKSIPAAFLDTVGSRSKIPFLNFGTLLRAPKNRSNPAPFVRRDRLPAEAPSAKCGNPLLIEDALGTAQFLDQIHSSDSMTER